MAMPPPLPGQTPLPQADTPRVDTPVYTRPPVNRQTPAETLPSPILCMRSVIINLS